MAEQKQQAVPKRKTRSPEQIKARIAASLRGRIALDEKIEGVVPCNRGFFMLEEIRKGEVVKKRQRVRAKPRGER